MFRLRPTRLGKTRGNGPGARVLLPRMKQSKCVVGTYVPVPSPQTFRSLRLTPVPLWNSQESPCTSYAETGVRRTCGQRPTATLPYGKHPSLLWDGTSTGPSTTWGHPPTYPLSPGTRTLYEECSEPRPRQYPDPFFLGSEPSPVVGPVHPSPGYTPLPSFPPPLHSQGR